MSYFAAEEIFYEYDRMVDRLSRLHCYGNVIPSANLDELTERNSRLAKDDLLNFAIHSRRLLTVAEAVQLAIDAKVPVYKFKDDGASIQKVPTNSPVNIWKVINTIVHYERLTFLDSNFSIRLYGLGTVRDEDFMKANARYVIPLVALNSDRNKPFCFEIREFVDIFYKNVLVQLIALLSERGVHVEAFLRETG